MENTDFTVMRDGGSIFLVTPVSPDAKEWMKNNISEDATYLGDSVGVEHQFIHGVTIGMIESGLVGTMNGRKLAVSSESDIVFA